ncbi:MAG: hypothetical protein K2G31_04520, partial [Clostridia bacterium]|nr:hypothetical protein [Clostridia bacterium]
MTRSFATGTAAESYSPVITDVKNLPVYYDITKVANELSSALDVIEYGKGGQTLTSYTNKVISSKNYYRSGSSTTTSGSYYKTAQFQFSDTYDYSYPTDNQFKMSSVTTDANYRKYSGVGGYYCYGSSWSTFYADTNTTYAGYNLNRMCAGIKSVKIGDSTTFNMYGTAGTTSSSAYGAGLYRAIYVGNASTPVGCAEVIKDSNQRVSVMIYMFTNANVKITLTDYGNNSSEYTTNFKGIDLVAPTQNVTTTDTDIMYYGTDTTKLNVQDMQWIKADTAKFAMNGTTGGSTSDANYSPYFWFYTVKKADTFEKFKTLNPTQDANNMFGNSNYKNLMPIGFRTLQNFEYDFKTGKAKAYDAGAYNVANPGCLSNDPYAQNPTGSGYYCFSFYVMDAAGNFSTSVRHFFVRVDYENPQYDVNLSYVKDSDGSIVNITAAENGKWATGETTLEIIFNKANISGNTLLFTDSNDRSFYLTFDRALASQRFISFNDEIMSGNSKTLNIYTNINNTDITILYEDIGEYGAKFIITFAGAVDGVYPNVAWTTPFTSYVGTYKSSDDVDKETSKVISWVNSAWGSGVQVLIDRNIPEAPVLSDDGEFLKEGANNYSMNFADKHWFTASNYNLPAKVSFEDTLSNNETYNSGIIVYYGIKFVTDAESLGALATMQDDRLVDIIGTMYKDITSANGNDYFDRFVGRSVKALGGVYADFPLDLIEIRRSGMRVVYSWVVDQAGNYSDINIYYVLADAQTYTIRSNVRVTGVLENGTATIAQKNSEGVSGVTSFKRGDVVTIELGFTDRSDDGGAKYVPFRFARTDKIGYDPTSNIVDLLLENYSPQSTWVKISDFANLISFDTYNTLNYTVDSNTTLGTLDTTMYFQLAHRKVITYQVTETRVAYSAKPAEVPISCDPIAATHFVFRYVDKDDNVLYIRDGGDVSNGNDDVTTNIDEAGMDGGTPTYFVPIIPDTYRVRIYIPKSDEYFVTNDYTSTNGEQTFVSCTIDFTIRKGEATVKAISNNALYGDKIDSTVLRYTIEGYEGEVTSGSLKLNVANWDPNELIHVGRYQIIEDEKFYINEYYNVTFESAELRIAPRGITISTWAQSKAYGDDDPSFKFGVSAAQFDWYTSRGDGYTVDSIVAKIFANFGSFTIESVDEVDYYLFSVSKSYINRSSGEDVDTYDYIVYTTMFDLGEDFTVSAQTAQMFTILQRTVVLDVGNQSTVLLSDVIPVYSDIIPTYTLSREDMHLSDRIAEMLSGKLSIDPNLLTATDVPAGYTKWEWHTVLLASDASNDNIRFVLGDDTVYIIYFADAILIKLKQGVSFSAMFGTIWSESLVTFSTEKFELTSKQEIPDFDSITWTVSLKGVDVGTYASVGSYAVTISDIKLIKNGAEIEDCFVIAESFNFTITAATVVVRPTASINASNISTKTYGEPESVFNIGFEIVSVGGRPVEDYLVAGYTYEQIYKQISGEFVRGWFASTGDFREFGTRNSAATDENGFVVGTDGDYYAFYVGSEFRSGDRNFTVVTELNDTVRFHILPKEIMLDAANFVGVSKSYDGSTNVNYNRVTAYSISDQLAFTSDDLRLAFEAQYSEIGSIERET